MQTWAKPLVTGSTTLPGKRGKHPNIVGLIIQRGLGHRPRVRRPRIIELEIRLGWRLLQRRHKIPLAQRRRSCTVAAICSRALGCAAARVSRELRSGSAYQKARRWTRELLSHLLPARPIGKPGMKHRRGGMTGASQGHVSQINEAEWVHAMDIVGIFQRRRRERSRTVLDPCCTRPPTGKVLLA